MITDDAMEVHFGLRLLDKAADHAYCHNYPCVSQARKHDTCSDGQVIRATLSKMHPRSE